MPSTRRSRRNRAESWGGLVALGGLAAMTALGALFLPDPPTVPRYLGAGSATPQRGGTFVFHHESDVRGFDPHISFDELSGMGIKLLFEQLVDYAYVDGELVLEPRLLTAMPTASEDGLLYTFELREDVRFADDPCFEDGRGRRITAEDVRWSLEHMLHPDTGSPGASFYSPIAGLEAFQRGEASHVSGIQVLDARRFTIRLAEPTQTFLATLGLYFTAPVAREAYEAYGDEIARHPVSTGPYLLESWEPGVRLTFVRNPRYYLAPERPYVDRMIYEVNLTRNPAVMRFRNGELDHLHRMSPTDYLTLRSLPEWAPYRTEQPKVNLWGIGMNTQLAPFTNRHLRRAVAFAVNRQQWRRARANRLALTGQPIPRQLLGFDEELEGQHRFDLTQAREEMRLAGHPDGLEEPVEVWVGEGDTGRSYGELIQSNLAEIGIEVRIRQVSFPIYLQESGRPGQVQMLLTGWSMDFPDPSNFLDVLFHSRSIADRNSSNRAFYSNPELDGLLDRARVEADRDRRREMYRQASRILVDDAPWAFVFSDVSMEMWQPYVRGYTPHPVWSNFYRDIWLDLPRRPFRSEAEAALGPLGRLRPMLGLGRASGGAGR
jgi:ABC-type transport system substrate-binding protein